MNLNEKLNEVLKRISESLDIPEKRYEQAEKCYKSIGEWLSRNNSSVKGMDPEIYPQGSFRLGTVIRPITENDEYDIDLVCKLEISKKDISQKELKILIGREIKAYAKAYNMNSLPEEGKRCWTLNYADGAQFHVDILPALPNGDDFKLLLESKGYKNYYSQYAISITDNTHLNYDKISVDWYCSNPKGYSEWFKERMRVQFDNEKRLLMEKFNASIEEIPEYKVKTPLQTVIQLLKRHRDIMFEKEPDDKPISIIITTLAALAYQNENNILEAYVNIVGNMEKFIQKKNDIYWVENPVNPLENFADKWVLYPKRRESFFKWIKQVKLDIAKSLSEEFIDTIDNYKHSYGEKTINEAISGIQFNNDKKVNAMSSLISRLNLSHRQRPKWKVLDYGDVTIKAFVDKNGFRNFELKSDEAIEKRCELRFEANTNITKPYKVYWQVTNTGREAELARCLRGDFYDGIMERGKLVRKETTSYTGRHLVECFIVKNEVCVARSGEFIVNIK